MAINFTISYTFSPSTTISSSQVNTNFSDNAAVWQGLEALTKSFAALRVDATATTSTDVAIKSYVDKLNAYRRPVLQFGSITTVAVESGLDGTSGDIPLLFPDGTLRTETSTTRTTFDITRNAALSGTAQSGLRTGLSEATNTWYALYGVKVTDTSTTWVTVGDTVLPLRSNFSTLNSNFGTNGWVFLGMIANGDNASHTGDILKFSMSGNMTIFRNDCAGNALSMSGTRLATTTATTSALTWSYAAGTAIGSAQIPNQISIGLMGIVTGAANGDPISITDSAQTYNTDKFVGGTVAISRRSVMQLLDGALLTNSNSTSSTKDMFLLAFWDGVLGIGANPLL